MCPERVLVTTMREAKEDTVGEAGKEFEEKEEVRHKEVWVGKGQDVPSKTFVGAFCQGCNPGGF